MSSLPMPDGLSFETAFFVDSVEEEYEWLDSNFPGFQMVKQSIQKVNERTYDVITIELEDGSPKKIYFDITDFYGNEPDFLS